MERRGEQPHLSGRPDRHHPGRAVVFRPDLRSRRKPCRKKRIATRAGQGTSGASWDKTGSGSIRAPARRPARARQGRGSARQGAGRPLSSEAARQAKAQARSLGEEAKERARPLRRGRQGGRHRAPRGFRAGDPRRPATSSASAIRPWRRRSSARRRAGWKACRARSAARRFEDVIELGAPLRTRPIRPPSSAARCSPASRSAASRAPPGRHDSDDDAMRRLAGRGRSTARGRLVAAPVRRQRGRCASALRRARAIRPASARRSRRRRAAWAIPPTSRSGAGLCRRRHGNEPTGSVAVERDRPLGHRLRLFRRQRARHRSPREAAS